MTIKCDHRRHRKIVREQFRNSQQSTTVHWIACAECDEILIPWTQESQSLWPRDLPPREIPIESVSPPKWDYIDRRLI